MSNLAKTSRDAMKMKAKRLASGDPHEKVDSSTWMPPEPEDAGVKTGARPISKRQYKSGGKVHGHHAKKRADRAKRKDGGRATRYLTPDNLINRDVRMANDVREGTKHVGAFKHGGKAKRHKHADGDVAMGLVRPTDDTVGDMIREQQMEKAMTGRGLPARVPVPSRRPVMKAAPAADQIPNNINFYKKGGKTEGGKKWIQGAIKHPGALHKALHVPEGEKIPAKKLAKAAHSSNPTMRKRAALAQTLKGMHHASGGKAGHPDIAEDKALIRKMVKPKALKRDGGEVFMGDSKSKVPGVTGGRKAHAKGGKTKGKTNISINVMPHAPSMGGMQMPSAPAPMPPAPPMPPRPPMGGPAAPVAPMAPPIPPAFSGAMPPRPGMPMARKHGGRTTHVIEHASGGGLGRLEKIKAYGEKQKKL